MSGINRRRINKVFKEIAPILASIKNYANGNLSVHMHVNEITNIMDSYQYDPKTEKRRTDNIKHNIKKSLLLSLCLLFFSGCAYSSANLVQVTGKDLDVSYGLTGMKFTGADKITIYRSTNPKITLKEIEENLNVEETIIESD